MPCTTFLILRSGPKDRVSKDANAICRAVSRISKQSLGEHPRLIPDGRPVSFGARR
jgi:hypothetical protein